MRAKASRTFETSGRVLIFSDANPDTDAGNTQSAQQVKELSEQMRHVAAAQRQGLVGQAVVRRRGPCPGKIPKVEYSALSIDAFSRPQN
jgi:hypothetical protein